MSLNIRQHILHLSPGCTSWSRAVVSDFCPRHGNGKRCVVKDGMTSRAVCCHAPSLECQLQESISADKDEVACLIAVRLKGLKTTPEVLTLLPFTCRSRCPVPPAGRSQIVVLSLRALLSWDTVRGETVAEFAAPQDLMGQQVSLSAVGSDHRRKGPRPPTDPADLSLMQSPDFSVTFHQ